MQSVLVSQTFPTFRDYFRFDLVAKREEDLRGAGGAEDVREDPEALKALVNFNIYLANSTNFEVNSTLLRGF